MVDQNKNSLNLYPAGQTSAEALAPLEQDTIKSLLKVATEQAAYGVDGVASRTVKLGLPEFNHHVATVERSKPGRSLVASDELAVIDVLEEDVEGSNYEVHSIYHVTQGIYGQLEITKETVSDAPIGSAEPLDDLFAEHEADTNAVSDEDIQDLTALLSGLQPMPVEGPKA